MKQLVSLKRRRELEKRAESFVDKMVSKVQQRRHKLGWSMRRLAREACVEPSTVLRIERGGRNPSMLMFAKLLIVLEEEERRRNG